MGGAKKNGKHRMQRPKQIMALVTMNRNPCNSRRSHARVAVVHPVGVAREGTGEGAHSATRRPRAPTATSVAEDHGRAHGNAARTAIEDATPIGNASEPTAGEGTWHRW